MGGISRGREVINQVLAAGLQFAPHMFPHIHSQVLGALGYTEAPIEWGVPGTGVHPMDDSLLRPKIRDGGRMDPLEELPGFGSLVDADWIRSRPDDDPSGLLKERSVVDSRRRSRRGDQPYSGRWDDRLRRACR